IAPDGSPGEGLKTIRVPIGTARYGKRTVPAGLGHQHSLPGTKACPERGPKGAGLSDSAAEAAGVIAWHTLSQNLRTSRLRCLRKPQRNFSPRYKENPIWLTTWKDGKYSATDGKHARTGL